MQTRRIPLEQRFWPKVNKNGPIPEYNPSLDKCWIWIAHTDRNGYGRIYSGEGKKPGADLSAHRVSFEMAIGKIPNELELDHLCKVRNCVNPYHLEPVTAQENKLRGVSPSAFHAKKTHCPKGHAYDEQNTRYEIRRSTKLRHCRKCATEYQKNLRAKRRIQYA